MKYAVIKIGGKQIKVKEGQTFEIERQKALKFDVLGYSNGNETFIGSPILADITVKASVTGLKLSKKVRVGRFKAKSRYDKVNGHRQPLSVVKIDKITKAGEKPDEPTTKATKPKKTAVKKVSSKKS